MGFMRFFRKQFARRIEADAISTEDTVIVILGPTGSGKSSFINRAANPKPKEQLPVGHGLSCQTQVVQSLRCRYPHDPNRTIVFVDTPAFDHDRLSPDEIKKMILTWMDNTFNQRVKVAGILYMHQITDRRLTKPPMTTLMDFCELCGNRIPQKIVLVTTMWGKLVSEDMGSARETGLRKTMMGFGSGMVRYNGTIESAWDAVDYLLKHAVGSSVVNVDT